MNRLYPSVALRAGHRCEYCRAPEAIFNMAFEVEHILPESLGGTDDLENLALCCRVCNLRKSAHTVGRDPEENKDVPLYHPRRERFDDNFQIDQDSGAIVGLTAAGRATVARLDMNSAAQISARLQWIQLAIFP